MSLRSYKLNNSYTVYVNYIYLNECIRASKKQAGKKRSHNDFSKDAIVQRNDQTVFASKNAVKIGSTVRLLNMDTHQNCTYIITAPDSLSIDTNSISSASPVGKSLLNRKVGDHVSVVIPAGTVRYKVLSFAN